MSKTTTGGARLAASKTVSTSDVARARSHIQRNAQQSTGIEANTFYKILISEEANPDKEERMKEFASYMTTTMDMVQDRARVEEYKKFREWMAQLVTALARQVVESTSTEHFATLQNVLNSMTTEFIEINRAMDPLLDIVDSIRYLTEKDLLVDAFGELEKEERERQARELAKAEALEKAAEAAANIRRLEDENAALAQKRGFFGFGGVPEAVRQEIARNELSIGRSRADETDAKEKIAELEAPPPAKADADPERELHVSRLRDMLNLNDDGNRQLMENVRQRSLSFIDTSVEKGALIRQEYSHIEKQVYLAEDNTRNLLDVVSIMAEGMKGASTNTIKIRDEVAAELELVKDNVMMKNVVDEKIRTVDEHTKHLHSAHSATLRSYSDLTSQAISIGTIKETVRNNIEVAENDSIQGVATMADGISTVMTVISNAAVTESSSVYANIRDKMATRTREITKQEIMRNAGKAHQISATLESILGAMEEFGEVKRHSNEVVRGGLDMMNANMMAMKAQADHLRDEIRQTEAIYSEYAITDDVDFAPVAPVQSKSGGGFFKS